MCFRKTKTLAIIGNGFDQNHGYHTGYFDFVNATHSACLDQFRVLCESSGIDKDSWYYFEDNIRIITQRMFQESMTEDCDFEANRKAVNEIQHTFEEIHDLLIAYLKQEIERKPMVKKVSIGKYLNKNAVAINFNYTATANAYTPNVIHVHGSLKENDILLGYDYRDEPCLAQFEDMRWSKRLCRESLAFRRHYLREENYDPDDEKYISLASGLESHHHWENTGRGIDDEVETFIPEYQEIHEFLQRYRNSSILPNVKYSDIKTLVVLGHGIEADQDYLQEIVSRCSNLKQVIIYRFDGETDESFEKKRNFFAPYCSSIKSVRY